MNEKYCVKCGAQLSLDANFCFKCGTSVGQPAVLDNAQWEYCEVKQDNRGGCLALGIGDYAWFYADALGPKGTYIAGRSSALNAYKVSYYGPTSDLPNASDLRAFEKLHSDFVKILLQDGWEPTPERGENWWNLRFKRKVKSTDQLNAGEKLAFDVVLLTAGPNKIDVIKAIRQLTNLGLKEAKDLAETPNAVVLQSVGKGQAENAKVALEKAGGTARLQ